MRRNYASLTVWGVGVCLLGWAVEVWAHNVTRTAAPGAEATRAAAPEAPLYAYRGVGSHAGYGYLAHSEAEAGHAFNFSCDTSVQTSYIENSSCARSVVSTEASFRHLRDEVVYPEYLKQLRGKVVEHAVLQLWALRGGQAPNLSSYSAVNDLDCDGSPGPSVGAGYDAVRNLPNRPLSPASGIGLSDVRAIRTSVGAEIADRTRVVADGLSDQNVSSALVLASFYFNGLTLNHCTTAARARDAQTPRCRSIQRALFRLRSSYPLIFNSDVGEPTLSRDASASVQAMGTALSASTNATTRAQGAVLQQVLSGTYVPTQAPSAIAGAVAALLPSLPASSPLRSRLQDLRNGHEGRLRTLLSNLCSIRARRGASVDRADLEATSLVASDPAAARQLLLDASREGASSRSLVQAGLCMDPTYVEHVRPLSCGRPYSSRLEVIPNQPTATVVAGRNEADYPFGSDIHYRISTVNGRRKVQQRINLVVPPGANGAPGVSPSAATIAQWQAGLRSFFNGEAARLRQPVDFEFQVTTTSAPVSDGMNITYHPCWCSTCSAALPPPNSVPPARDACGIPDRMMQADSGNFHAQVDLKTVLHEAGHGLGLSDEYLADYYPFNSLGEANSIMREEQAPYHLYPRHFEQILNPGLCD